MPGSEHIGPPHTIDWGIKRVALRPGVQIDGKTELIGAEVKVQPGWVSVREHGQVTHYPSDLVLYVRDS